MSVSTGEGRTVCGSCLWGDAPWERCLLRVMEASWSHLQVWLARPTCQTLGVNVRHWMVTKGNIRRCWQETWSLEGSFDTIVYVVHWKPQHLLFCQEPVFLWPFRGLSCSCRHFGSCPDWCRLWTPRVLLVTPKSLLLIWAWQECPHLCVLIFLF